MSRLTRDFGVSALIAVLIVVGAFTAIIIGILNGSISMTLILPMLGAWVGSATAAYLTVKATKTNIENKIVAFRADS